MAKALKGCINDECIAKQKRMYFKESDMYCPKCGKPLCYVCKRCGMKLPDNSRRYCIRCENEMKDERDEWGKTIMNGVGKGMLKAGKSISDGSKKSINIIEKTGKNIVHIAENKTVELKSKIKNVTESNKNSKDN